MKKQLTAGILAALTLALVVGCEPHPVTTPAQTPSQDQEKDTNIKVRGPNGGGVDINTNGKKGDTNVDVDIRRKDTRR